MSGCVKNRRAVGRTHRASALNIEALPTGKHPGGANNKDQEQT
ncbi:hypothetical protein [Ralstonia syzygii]|nr:hypothetical protein [Ralstonia syzygii]